MAEIYFFVRKYIQGTNQDSQAASHSEFSQKQRVHLLVHAQYACESHLKLKP